LPDYRRGFPLERILGCRHLKPRCEKSRRGAEVLADDRETEVTHASEPLGLFSRLARLSG
jgi:hypothetical protein